MSGLARLTLARFYLANGFAAEALGLLNLIQSHDPALAGDTQLATMRAAADYMMGRYRDAHNDLSGPSFDADRHAAFWRGLIEAAHGKLEERPCPSGAGRAGDEPLSRPTGRPAPCWPMPMRRWAWAGWTWRTRRCTGCPRIWTRSRRWPPNWRRPA